MKKKEPKEPEHKEPIDMTTDEAIDYVFAPEIAEELRKVVGKSKPDPAPCEEPESD